MEEEKEKSEEIEPVYYPGLYDPITRITYFLNEKNGLIIKQSYDEGNKIYSKIGEFTKEELGIELTKEQLDYLYDEEEEEKWRT